MYDVMVQWDKGRVRGIGWSAAQQLIVCVEDGMIYHYSYSGVFIKSYSLGRVRVFGFLFLYVLTLNNVVIQFILIAFNSYLVDHL